MPLQKLNLVPGIKRENTKYTSEGSWWDMDKVRFRSGSPEKIGGWRPLMNVPFSGVARFLHDWMTINNSHLLAVGTNTHLYVAYDGAYYDITPVRASVTEANPILTGAAGSSVVTVTTTANHGMATGDRVIISGAATVDGILAATINTEHTVLSTPTVKTFTISLSPCTAGATSGGGAAVVIQYLTNISPPWVVTGVGFGVSGYGLGGFGAAADAQSGGYGPVVGTGTGGGSGGTMQYLGLRQWSGWNFGQDLVVSIRSGGLYYWSADNALISASLAARAVDITTIATDAPSMADHVIVTDDQHIVTFGSDAIGSIGTRDPMLIRWCSQSEPLMWTPLITNTAGDQRLNSGSYITAVRKMRQETLVWTDTSVVSMQYAGAPIVFSFNTLASNISVASAGAVAIANNVAYWMGKDKFYVYDGQVQTLPCDVRGYVFDDINTEQIDQVLSGTIERFNEIIWFYPSAASNTTDRYVSYNYAERLWTYGTLSRTAWLDAPMRVNPIAASADGYLYEHEVGVDAVTTTGATAINAYIEAADIDIGDGQKFMYVQRILPDVDFSRSTAAVPEVTITLNARDTPGSTYLQTNPRRVAQTSQVVFRQFTEMAWTRIRGRQVSMRVESNSTGVAWQLGLTRIDVREDGQR